MPYSSLRHALPLILALGLCGTALAADQDSTAVKPITLTATQFKAFEGEYALAPNFFIIFFQQDGKFMSRGSGQPAFEIFADSPETFFATAAPIKIRFTKDAAGRVTDMILTQGGHTMPPAPRTK